MFPTEAYKFQIISIIGRILFVDAPAIAYESMMADARRVRYPVSIYTIVLISAIAHVSGLTLVVECR